MSRNRNNNGGDTKIPGTVEDFAKMTLKKHKKHYGEYFDSKKDLKRDYFDSLITNLPDTIDWLLRNKHKPQEKVQEIKNMCYAKFGGADGPEFNKYILKMIDKYGVDDIPNLEYLPIILSELIKEILRYNEQQEAMGEDSAKDIVKSPDDLYELMNTILKKRLKKAEKKGIPSAAAFDLLTVMPVKDATKYSAFFRVKGVFDIMYLHAAQDSIPFELTVKFLFDKTDYKYVIGYALQERKDKYKTFNETQKKLFNDITSWCFNELEDMDKDDIRKILNDYIRVRKRDASQGKDSNRRYYISSLPDKDYPSIMKVVSELLRNEENKKYL